MVQKAGPPLDSNLVEQQSCKEGWNNDDPETRKAARKVMSPGPLIFNQPLEYVTANKKSAQRKKYDDGLMAKASAKIEHGLWETRNGEARIRLKNVRPRVPKQNKKRRRATQHIEMLKPIRRRRDF